MDKLSERFKNAHYELTWKLSVEQDAVFQAMSEELEMMVSEMPKQFTKSQFSGFINIDHNIKKLIWSMEDVENKDSEIWLLTKKTNKMYQRLKVEKTVFQSQEDSDYESGYEICPVPARRQVSEPEIVPEIIPEQKPVQKKEEHKTKAKKSSKSDKEWFDRTPCQQSKCIDYARYGFEQPTHCKFHNSNGMKLFKVKPTGVKKITDDATRNEIIRKH